MPDASDAQNQNPLEIVLRDQGISAKKRQAILTKFSASIFQVEESYSGVLPHPEHLERFNQIIPNGADRLLKMTEAQSNHRIFIERVVIIAQQILMFTGQGSALCVALMGFYFASQCSNPYVAGLIGGGTLTSLVFAFLHGKKEQKESLKKKAPSS